MSAAVRARALEISAWLAGFGAVHSGPRSFASTVSTSTQAATGGYSRPLLSAVANAAYAGLLVSLVPLAAEARAGHRPLLIANRCWLSWPVRNLTHSNEAAGFLELFQIERLDPPTKLKAP